MYDDYQASLEFGLREKFPKHYVILKNQALAAQKEQQKFAENMSVIPKNNLEMSQIDEDLDNSKNYFEPAVQGSLESFKFSSQQQSSKGAQKTDDTKSKHTMQNTIAGISSIR